MDNSFPKVSLLIALAFLGGCLQSESPVLSENDVEILSDEINSFLTGSQCAWNSVAVMKHPAEDVFSVKPNGDMAYVSRNYIGEELRLRTSNVWNLARIAKIEMRATGDCATLRVFCQPNDECHGIIGVKDGKPNPFSVDYPGSIYFADRKHAKRAYQTLTRLAKQIANNPQVEQAPSATARNSNRDNDEYTRALEEKNRQLEEKLEANRQAETRRQQEIERQRVCGGRTCVTLKDGTVLFQTKNGRDWYYGDGTKVPEEEEPK